MRNRFTKLITIAAVLCVAAMPASFLAGAHASQIAEKSFEVGVEPIFGQDESAKFNEYRYPKDGDFDASTKVHLITPHGENTEYILDAYGNSHSDIGGAFKSVTQGSKTWGLSFKRIGHTYVLNSKTLFSGVNSNLLSVADDIQSKLQQNGLQDYSAKPDTMIDRLQPFVDAANTADVRATRDILGYNYQKIGKLFTRNFDVTHEFRRGSKTTSLAFGFADAIEFPEPINYRTTNFTLSEERVGAPYYLKWELKHSIFDNGYQTVLVENPFRITDSSHPGGYSFGQDTGAAAGRYALPPSNFASQSTVSFSKPLSERSDIAVDASYGIMRQREKVVPHMNNTAMDTLGSLLPGGVLYGAWKADAQVTNLLADMHYSSEVGSKGRLGVSYKFDERKNRTTRLGFRNIIQVDDAIGTTNAPITYVGSTAKQVEIEYEYEPNHKTTYSFGAEGVHESFKEGSANVVRERVYKFGVTSRGIENVLLRTNIEREERRSEYPNYEQVEQIYYNIAWQDDLPWTRKFYAATRDRHKITTMASYTPTDKFTVNIDLNFTDDDYYRSVFGLQRERRHGGTLEFDQELTERLSWNGSVTSDRTWSFMKSRQWTQGSTGDPYSNIGRDIDNPSNWTLALDEVDRTLEMGMQFTLVPDRLLLNFTGNYIRIEGTGDFESPIGSLATDANAYDPGDLRQTDNSRRKTLDVNLKYTNESGRSWLKLGYTAERFTMEDPYYFDGQMTAPTAYTGKWYGMLNMDSIYRDYKVKTVYLTANISY